jgi:hypothetical protein
VIIQNTVFMRNTKKRFFYHFPKYRMKILLGDLKQKWGERILSKRRFGMGAYITILVIMV